LRKQGFVIHEWELIEPNPCLSKQVCKRCGEITNIHEKEHQWNNVYLSPYSCDMEKRCSRCGIIKEKSIVHEWELIVQNPCLSQQVCKRCGEIGKIEEKEHHWKQSYNPNSYDIQETCDRCGITKSRQSEFSRFVGQEEIKRSLITLVAAANQKGEPLHHLLLCGPLGMGKVILARIIAAEMRVNTKIISGKTIEKAGDFAAILINLRAGDFLIIEQIESLRKQVLEVLVPAAADFDIEIMIGKGPSARNIKLKLPRFTIVGTTTRPMQVDERLNSLMFAFNLAPYKKNEICEILSLAATKQGIYLEVEATNLLSEQCNGIPGEALVVLNKVHKYAIAYADGQINSTIARDALAVFGSNNNFPVFERQSIPDDVKMFVWQRDRGCCAKCGNQENLEYDHIIPVSKGGSNTARNIQLLCEKCNRSKSANIA